MFTHSLWSFVFWLHIVAAIYVRPNSVEKPFSCTGGSIYFIAHPLDALLYQNPDLLHDLYVFKCVTTVVMTSGARGMGGNRSLSHERGLQEAYVLMADIPVTDPAREETMIRLNTHNVHSWSLKGIPNIQIIYLRLPDGPPSGQGYDTNGGRSLYKLYQNETNSLTSTDGNETYTLIELKKLIAFTLHSRKPNDVRILNHKATAVDEYELNKPSDHVDHIVSSKLVRSVITEEKINVNVKSYAGNVIHKFKANIKYTNHDFTRKATAFFKYAAYDDDMCQSFEDCSARSELEVDKFFDDDVRYVTQYLNREYFVL